MTAICQEKIKNLNEIVDYTDFFLSNPRNMREKRFRTVEGQDAAQRMKRVRDVFANVDDWNVESFKKRFEALAAETGETTGRFIHPTRLA